MVQLLLAHPLYAGTYRCIMCETCGADKSQKATQVTQRHRISLDQTEVYLISDGARPASAKIHLAGPVSR